MDRNIPVQQWAEGFADEARAVMNHERRIHNFVCAGSLDSSDDLAP